MTRVKFKKTIWSYYRTHGRKLPWRNTRNPYKILVSEIMLQQTQVERVLPKYKLFLKRFPDFETLASAPKRNVLQIWQGLGYNRRALALKALAEIVMRNHKGNLPKDPDLLLHFPGIGPATTGAVSAFAFKKAIPFIETNIRRVFIHFFFNKKGARVTDEEIQTLVRQTLDEENPREWFYALMDYGAMLGKRKRNPNRKSVHYRRQPRFAYSMRELRGTILKLLLKEKLLPVKKISELTSRTEADVEEALKALEKEQFLLRKSRSIILA